MAEPWFNTLTPEARAAQIEKMKAGRARKKEERKHLPAVVELQHPTDYDPLESLRATQWQEQSESYLRRAIMIIDEAKERAANRLRIIVDKRSGEFCGNPKCARPFGNIRHFGELSFHDPLIANNIRVLRACSPACYAVIQGIMATEKQTALERQHSKFSHA
jgi:hypothetical protein